LPTKRLQKNIYEIFKIIPHFVCNPAAITTRTEGYVGMYVHNDIDRYSWYVIDKNFHRQKLKIMLSKLGNNK